MTTVSAPLTHSAAEFSPVEISSLRAKPHCNANKMGLLTFCFPNVRQSFQTNPNWPRCSSIRTLSGTLQVPLQPKHRPYLLQLDAHFYLQMALAPLSGLLTMTFSLFEDEICISLSLHQWLLLSEWIQQVPLSRDELPLFENQETQTPHN